MRQGLRLLNVLLLAVPVLFGTLAPGQPTLTLMPADDASALGSALTTADGNGVAPESDDGTLYANGTRAIQEGRWADSVDIFSKVIARRGEHAEGAFYWRAYAENRLGKSAQALSTCEELRAAYPKSRWLDDCSALQIEIRGAAANANGAPKAGLNAPVRDEGDHLHLLSLNSQMRREEGHALPELFKILSGSNAEAYKEQALFVIAQGQSKAARKMLAEVAHPVAGTPESIRSNLPLQLRAQQLAAAATSKSGALPQPINRRIGLDVVVTGADGKPVTGLTATDFTITDNGVPVKLKTYLEVSRNQGNPSASENSQVILLLDTVNTRFSDVAYERDQVSRFLRQNGGQLNVPISVYFFTGKGAEHLSGPSRDGTTLAAAVDGAEATMHPIRRSQGFFGEQERTQLSLTALADLTAQQSAVPGRKILIWLSPGWPLLIESDAEFFTSQAKTVFRLVSSMSSALRDARITLDCINPLRTEGEESIEWDRYKNYRKPVTNPNSAKYGDLSLPILAEQSGGVAKNQGVKFLWEELKDILGNPSDYYYVSFDSLPAQKRDEYHALKITVNRPGAIVHTRSGYYAQP